MGGLLGKPDKTAEQRLPPSLAPLGRGSAEGELCNATEIHSHVLLTSSNDYKTKRHIYIIIYCASAGKL